MTQKEIQDLIKFVSKSGIAEVEIEKKDFKITVKTQVHTEATEKTVYVQQPMAMQQPAPSMMPAATPPAASAAPVAPQAVAQAPAAPAPAQEDTSNLITIKSPMIGTFYRSSSPDKPSFVEVGDTIKEGDAVCIIEAMKLFNEIEAEVKGKIVKVLVDDASPVEYDQPLFLVEPA